MRLAWWVSSMAAALDSSAVKWAFVAVLVVLLAATVWVQLRYLQVMRAQARGTTASRIDTSIRVINIALVAIAVAIALWAVTR